MSSKSTNVAVATISQVSKQKTWNKLKTEAGQNFKFGRQSTYKAVAQAYVWLQLAKTDEKYLENAFAGLPNQTNSSDFARAIVLCFSIDPVKQKSTVSKYKDVLEKLATLHQKNKASFNRKSSDDKVTFLANHIDKKGGITQLISSAGATKSTRMSSDDVVRQLATYNKSTRCLVNHPPKTAKYKDGLVITVARAKNNALSIVDTVTADEKSVKNIIATYKD